MAEAAQHLPAMSADCDTFYQPRCAFSSAAKSRQRDFEVRAFAVLFTSIDIVMLHDSKPRCLYREAHRGAKYRRATARPATTSEHDKFAAHLHQSRREYRHVCERAGKGNKQIERCVISTFQSLGFNGEFRQCEHLLRVAEAQGPDRGQ
jgi:hypothetical protein